MNRRALFFAWWLPATVWALLGFVAYFHFGQFGPIAWNAVELIIGQHLLDHGRYVLSLDYPSALPWRPVFPTVVLATLQGFTSDPRLILQTAYGLSAGALVGSLFLGAKLVWGRIAGHVAAALALACPGVTFALIGHIHGISHVIGLLALGPALAVTLYLLKRADGARAPSLPAFTAAGLLWGLCYLARSELLLFAGWAGLLLLIATWRRARAWLGLLTFAASFALCFLPYNVLAERAAREGELLIRKPIYGFYISQGWTDPRPNTSPDIEADGYLYAIELYGTPAENNESLLTAVRRHPEPFWRRVRLNATAYYARLTESGFLPLAWLIAAAAGAVCALASRDRASCRAALFLTGCFAATHFILIFHIDPRYLTIAVPPLLLLAGALVGTLLPDASEGTPGARRGAFVRVLAALAVVVALGWTGRGIANRWRAPGARDDRGLTAMKSLAEHFQASVPKPQLHQNREPQIALVLPPDVSMPGEDVFLLPYFSRTAWIGHGAEGAFPRGRFYSYRQRPADYVYLPAEHARRDPHHASRILAEYDNPILGRYALLGPPAP